MQIILFAFFCSVTCCIVTAQLNSVATLTLIPPPQSNWEEFTSSHQALKEGTKAKRDNFTCVLNLLKTALSEELANPKHQITEETKEPVVSINVLEVEPKAKENEDPEKQGIINENETVADKALYQKVITEIASAFSKPQNSSSNAEVPSMIPIFRPRQVPRPELKQETSESNPALLTRQIPKSRAVSFVPERIVQTSMNPFPSQPMFNIPCQRAADVLDMTNIAIPKEAVCRNINAKPNVNPIVEMPKPVLPSQTPAPVTLSVTCDDSDDIVAMLFKPKNISHVQQDGNLLKKITMTVLVPYHVSKLGGK